MGFIAFAASTGDPLKVPAGVRPVFHHKRESIEAHLTIVFAAALAVSRYLEDATGWSIKKFVRTARRYRTIEIQAGAYTITAADPLPEDLATALHALPAGSAGAHKRGKGQERLSLAHAMSVTSSARLGWEPLQTLLA